MAKKAASKKPKAVKRPTATQLAALEKEANEGQSPYREVSFANTGSTLVNIGLSGLWDGGWPLGGYNLIAGGSSSGKTVLVMSTLAEAANNPKFDDYLLVYDGPEGGAMLQMAEAMFGAKLRSRLRVPCRGTSYSIEEFYGNLRAHAEAGHKFIWALDSMDSLTSEQERAVNTNNDLATLMGSDLLGSYGDGKARFNSQNIRTIMEHLVSSDSLLLIICQTRDSLAGQFSEAVYSGGRALRFYADCRMWTTGTGKIEKTAKGVEIPIGNKMRCRVDKNRVRGRNFEATMPIFYHIGIDDIGSVVDYLTEWKKWKAKEGGIIEAGDFGLSCTREEIVAWVEAHDYADELRLIAQEHWMAIEAAVADSVKRKPRYE